MSFKKRIVGVLLLLCVSERINGFNVSDVDVDGKPSEILSRRKRFLIFPEGSSVQLVFCLTFPMIFTISDIFLYGYTAALAWELPQDPYSPFNHKADPLHRRVDSKNVLFTDERGRVLFKRPYKKKVIVNPAMAKRSIAEDTESILNLKMDRRQMHEAQKSRQFLKNEHMDVNTAEFHRSSRVQLYGKIESLLKGFGANGRQCTLRALCQVGQASEHQGAFLQEILRAVFTLPKGQSFGDEYLDEYDVAHQKKGESCEKLYPECEEPIQEPGTLNFSI